MARFLNDPTNQTKLGVAILGLCVVQTLAESDATLKERFLAHLEKAYDDARDQADPHCLELLMWIRQMVEADEVGDISGG